MPGQTVVVGVAPETHLRLMAQALAEARPLWRRRVSAASIQAVANAFAMLGLVSAEGAEAAMTQASRALGLRREGGRGSARCLKGLLVLAGGQISDGSHVLETRIGCFG